MLFFPLIVSAICQCLGAQAMINNRVSIGGLFPVHRNNGGHCGVINKAPFVNVEAMIFAVKSINKNFSLLPNVTLTFNIRDTCGINNVALEETVGLMEIGRTGEVSDIGISAVIGAANSDVSISVASLLRIFQIPQISYSSTATTLSDQQRFDYFFRTIPPDSLQAKAMADLIVYFNWTYIVGIYTDDTYGRDGINSLIVELNKNNNTHICIVTEPDITALPLHPSDSHYERLLSFLNQSWIRNSSVAVLFGQQQAAIDLLEAIRIYGAASFDHLTWIASDAWATRVPDKYHHIVRGMLGVVPTIQHLESFDEYYESLKPGNHSALNPWFDEFWESEFNCSLTLNQSEEEKQVCDVESQVLMHDNSSVANAVAYVIDAVYAIAYTIESLLEDRCPNSTGLCQHVMTERFSRKVLNGIKLREYLYNVSFISPTSNKVQFDKMGDEQGFYEIVNLGRSGVRKVGTWNSDDFLQITDDIEWRGGMDKPESTCSLPCDAGEEPMLVPDRSDCCWTCEHCIGENTISAGTKCTVCAVGTSPNEDKGLCILNPIVFLEWHDSWAVVILLCTTLGLATTAFIVVIYIIFNKHKIIMATSRELSGILLTGIALCYILPFFFIAAPSPATCAIRRFSVGVCFSLCFSPLLMKTNRIYRVFHQAPRTPRFAGSLSQVVFTCSLIFVQVFIASLWLGLEKPSVRLVNGTKTNERICGENPYVGLPVSLLYNLLLLVLSTFYAFLGREIPAKFSETKFIAITLYTICVIWLGFFPTYFAIIELGTVYQTVSLVFAVLLSATTTLGCLFIPKVILLFIELPKDKKAAAATKIEREMPSCSSITTDFKVSGDSGNDSVCSL